MKRSFFRKRYNFWSNLFAILTVLALASIVFFLLAGLFFDYPFIKMLEKISISLVLFIILSVVTFTLIKINK